MAEHVSFRSPPERQALAYMELSAREIIPFLPVFRLDAEVRLVSRPDENATTSEPPAIPQPGPLPPSRTISAHHARKHGVERWRPVSVSGQAARGLTAPEQGGSCSVRHFLPTPEPDAGSLAGVRTKSDLAGVIGSL